MIRFDDTNGRAEMKGDWDWEAGLGRDQIRDAEYIRDYGLLVAYSNWAYAKNVSKKREAFRGAELEWVAYIAGRRETRRQMGDFILTEKHIQDREFQPDGTCAPSGGNSAFPDEGAFRISFFRPFYGDYRIIWLSPDYDLALVTGEDRSSRWILACSASIPAERRDALVKMASDRGFDVSKLEYPE